MESDWTCPENAHIYCLALIGTTTYYISYCPDIPLSEPGFENTIHTYQNLIPNS